ncbi:MAG: LysR family transcriptional regulator, partial [Porphyromonadaceae bacterium]|nr:LysR family transcriptional regulator [Porphyromonadaceae bacterium]
TLSRQVRALELELRASLFHRHGRGVRLTERGNTFIEYARSIIHTMETAIHSVRDSSAMYAGNLVIGLTPSIGRVLIPKLAPRLKEKFPLASLRLTEGLSGALYDKVLLGQVDFALVLSPAGSPNLQIEPLATEQLYLVGPKGEGSQSATVTLREVVQYPLILPYSNQWTRPTLETEAARLGLQLNIILEIDSTASTIEIVAKGGGYAILPGSLQKLSSLPELSWQKIVEPQLGSTISLISQTRQARSILSQAASPLVKETLLEVFNGVSTNDYKDGVDQNG